MTGERPQPVTRNRDKAVPPGPKGLPVVGPLLDLRRDVLTTLHRAMVRFGDIVRFAGGPPGRRVRIYALFHPDDVQRLRMTGDDVYSKEDPSSLEVRAFLGNGVLNSGGSVWRRQRRILEPLFTPERVADFFPIIAIEADRLVAAWRGAAERGRSVDLDRDSTEVSRRVIANVLFGEDAERMLPLIAEHLMYLSQRAFKRGVAPIRIPETWPTPGNRKAARGRQALRDGVDEVIARRRRQPSDGDLVGLMLQAPDPEGGPGLDDGEVRDQVFPFLLAGCDQPATHMAFVLHLLGNHSEAQRAVQEEVDAVVGDRPLTIADVAALSRTAAAVKESMRLYPSAYALSRQVERDEEYRSYRIPVGAQAVCAPWVTHRHPVFWEDPERFDLERFGPEAERARHPFAYFAFGGGPHGCLGRHLAMMEMVVVTATVMRSYRIVTEGRSIPLSIGINIRPRTAIPARVTAR